VDCWNQVSSDPGFDDVRGSAGSKRCRNEIGIFVDGQEYDPRSAVRLLEPFGSFKSIQNGHGNIDNKNISIQPQDGVEGLIAVLRCADDFKLVAECFTNACDYRMMIIRKHHSNPGHGKPSDGVSHPD